MSIRIKILCTVAVIALASISAKMVLAQDDKKPSTTESAKPEAQTAVKKPTRDRWLVKTASDPDASKVKQKPNITTIEKLLGLPRPADFPLSETPAKYQEKRAEGVETSVYSVEAEIVEYRLMPDGDYRVVIRGGSGETMVLEMPDPAPEFVDPNSPFAYAIKSARNQFSAKFQPEKTSKTAIGHMKVTGIGYFGRAYGQKKDVKGNLIQLHPVLDIVWLDKPSQEFLATKKPESVTPPTVKPENAKPLQKPTDKP